jgi:hypothetical protein
MPTFRNLTPHPIRYRFDQENNAPEPLDTDVVFSEEKLPLRIAEDNSSAEMVGNFKIVHSVLGEIVNLPPEQDDVYLIVSMPLAQQAWMQGRRDCICGAAEGNVTFKLPNGQNGTYAIRAFRFIISDR